MLLKFDNGAVLVWYRTEIEAKFLSRRVLSPAVREYCALCGTTEKDVSFDRNGKPYFSDFPGHHLSITHAGDLLLFAFAPFPIGVDAELKSEERPKLAERYFNEEEMNAPFSQVWTAREAVGKLTGIGLSDALRVRVSEDHATLDGKEYTLTREILGEYFVTLAREKD